ncbi:hypothetical protein [Allosphingosinicella vermicomposti]|uniref:hypothetical protein n=1 Tax=Allosphingosinicella vermicomposti TaxID=614671 RepID=UPI00131A4FA6|nr:hypothetical protein [Allosphingosinicella vermicomposti]
MIITTKPRLAALFEAISISSLKMQAKPHPATTPPPRRDPVAFAAAIEVLG